MKTEEQKAKEFFDSLRSLKGNEMTYDLIVDTGNNVSLFPEKVKKAKAHLAKVGMPKEYYEQMAKKNKEKEE